MSEAPKTEPEPIEPILMECPQTGRLSLRLEVLSPEREVAMGQMDLTADVLIRAVPTLEFLRLTEALVDLERAITEHYPRARHIPAVEAAFTEYVKSRKDVPKKPNDETSEKQGDK